MKSQDQIIKHPSVIIMVIVILMVKIVVIIILASIYWTLTMCQALCVSILHCLGKMLWFSFVLSHNTSDTRLCGLFSDTDQFCDTS